MSVKILTLGAGGFGATYTRPLLDNINSGKYEYVGVVEICDDFPYIDEFEKNNIPVYKTMADFFAENTADLVVISTPPHFHKDHCIYAVEHGANVLCEKPIASSYEDAKAICEASERTGKFIAIGYQHSYAQSIIDLKSDVLNGVLGNPIELKTIVLWPRDWQYYGRSSGWAGRIRDDNNNLILDSVISNATAHYLHNMLFILGKTMDKTCLPQKYSAELLRANKIENYDTAVIRMKTEEDIDVLMIASHAITTWVHPIFEFKFENAVVTYECGKTNIVAKFNDGTVKDYGDPVIDIDNNKKLWDAISAASDGTQLPCVAETAMPHNIIINSLYEQCEVQDFPADLIINDEDEKRTFVSGLDDLLINAFKQGKMLSELNCEWAKKKEFCINNKYL